MHTWRRRARAAIGLGLTWAAAWFSAGLALAIAFPGAADVPFPILWGAIGVFGGAIFSGSASGTLALARRAQSGELAAGAASPELPGSD